MSSSADVSIAVAISVFFVNVLGVTTVSATCDSPQYAEYGQQGVIKCNFMPGFTGVFWYLSVNSKYQIVIRLEQQRDGILVRSGDGYSEGKYDIHPDGSLVISNITDYDKQSFKVVHVDKELLVEEYYVELLTAILPDPHFPLINLCNKTNLCLVEKIDSGMLTCSYNRSKPPVELVWYRHSHEGTHRLNGETMVTKDGDRTFSSVLTTNISNHINGPLITFSCHVANPELSVQVAESSVIVDTTKQTWPSLLENVKQETYFVMDSAAQVACNGNNKPITFVWERLWRTTTDILMFATKEKRLLYNVDSKWNISSDGSLVFTNIRFENEGLYTCTFFDGTRYVSSLIQVNVWVKPTPPFIFTNECPQEEETCEITVKDNHSPFNISCHLNGVYPNVPLAIETDSSSDTHIFRRNTYSGRRGNVYDITAVAQLSPIDCYTLINVSCYLPVPHPLIGGKVISVRSGECGSAGSSSVIVVITVIIVIILLIICVIVSLRFRKRFLNRTDIEKATNLEEVQPIRENLDSEDTKEPAKLGPSFTLVQHCEEIVDTLLHFQVNGTTEVFNEKVLDALKDKLKEINDKGQDSKNEGETSKWVPFDIGFLNSSFWNAWSAFLQMFSSPVQDDQTDEQRNENQQLIGNQLKRTLQTFVQLQKDLLHVTTSVALCYEIIKSVSNLNLNLNVSDDNYSDDLSQDIKTFLQSLKDEIEDDNDLLKILPRVDKQIGTFLTRLETLFLDREDFPVSEKLDYKRRIKERMNVLLDKLPSAIVTILKERKGTADDISIFNFVTKFYAQSFGQEDIDVTSLTKSLKNIEEWESKIRADIVKIAEGVSAASIDLSVFDENVNIDFLGCMAPFDDKNEEQVLQRNDTMIEIMKNMNQIAHSIKSST